MAVGSTTITTGGSTRFRQRKLNVKAALPILRERDIEPAEGGTVTNNASRAATGEPESKEAINDTPTTATASGRISALTPSESFTIGGLPKVESGVDTKEEKEHHLQAVITASAAAALGGKIAQQIFIPTPDAVDSVELRAQYDRLYPTRFAQPVTYIRFSSTVEDCVGVPYNMSEEDEAWLKVVNMKARAKSGGGANGNGNANANANGTSLPQHTMQCSEDWFEQVMNSFEETSASRQPFAAVDNTPVLGYEEMSAAFDDITPAVEDSARRFAPQIYEYWKAARLRRNNQPLVPKLKTLKMDAVAAEADDADPYVCFRRREVRQVRKTRGRDAQVGEKLKKLRKELEEGRQLLDLVRRRELGRLDELALARGIFEKRAAVRDMKRSLNIELGEDDELLVTQRTPKKKPLEIVPPSAMNAAAGAPNGGRPGASQPQQLRLLRNDSAVSATAAGGATEVDSVVLLRERIREREARIAEKMAQEMAVLEMLNERFVDHTEEAMMGLYVPLESEAGPLHMYGCGVDGWVSAKVEVTQQPTPPESVVSGGEEEEEVDGGVSVGVDMMDVDDDSRAASRRQQERYSDMLQLRWATESETQNSSSLRSAPRFRRRLGRGGRLFVDRRLPRDAKAVAEAAKRLAGGGSSGSDRWKYDHESGDELEPEPKEGELEKIAYGNAEALLEVKVKQ